MPAFPLPAEAHHNKGLPRPADEREWFRVHPKVGGARVQFIDAASQRERLSRAAEVRAILLLHTNLSRRPCCCIPEPLSSPSAGRRRGAAARRRAAPRRLCGRVPGRAVRRLALAGARRPLECAPLPGQLAVAVVLVVSMGCDAWFHSGPRLPPCPQARGAPSRATAACSCAWAPATSFTTSRWSGRRATRPDTTSCLST